LLFFILDFFCVFFLFHPSTFRFLIIELHDFFIYSASDFMTRVTGLISKSDCHLFCLIFFYDIVVWHCFSLKKMTLWFFFSIELFRTHDLWREFVKLIQTNSLLNIHIACLPCWFGLLCTIFLIIFLSYFSISCLID